MTPKDLKCDVMPAISFRRHMSNASRMFSIRATVSSRGMIDIFHLNLFWDKIDKKYIGRYIVHSIAGARNKGGCISAVH